MKRTIMVPVEIRARDKKHALSMYDDLVISGTSYSDSDDGFWSILTNRITKKQITEAFK